MTPLTRRRFLTISASAAALGASAVPSQAANWRGVALGARASMRLEGISAQSAAPLFAAVEAELARLEGIFSLYRPESQLSVLNGDGRLQAPAPELLDLLSLCSALHGATGGAFDPSIQPLWAAVAQGAPKPALDRARVLSDWRGVRFDSAKVHFARPGMALTLNGVAQGAITDRIAALLRAQGYGNVLIDMGEIAALGSRAAGGGWRAGIAAPDGRVLQRVTLRDRALATSAPEGTRIGPDGAGGHILHPQGHAPLHRLASVSAPSAAVADGLSTALCLLPEKAARQAVAQFPGARIELLA
ncbi:FAD:protein FMN transferase [Roseobacteraceae bacterium NS-SX3]